MQQATSTAVVLALLMVTTPAMAGHGGSAVTVHRTYEWGQAEIIGWECPTGWALSQLGQDEDCDPTDQTGDGSIDVGGVVIEPDDVPADVTHIRVSIVDDLFGPGRVGGDLCVSSDQPNICGYPGDITEEFCGSTGPHRLPADWKAVAVFVEGAIEQHLNGCDPTAYATTGGVVDAEGGIFATFE